MTDTYRQPASAARFGLVAVGITPAEPIRSRSWGAATQEVAEGVHRPLTATVLGIVDGPATRLPLWVWRLGDAVLVAHPGEAYSQIQTSCAGSCPRGGSRLQPVQWRASGPPAAS